MYAVVEIAGQQFKVEKDQEIFVHRIHSKEGDKIDLDKVLLIDDSGKLNIGTPNVKNAKVTAKVLKHLKGDKEIVFKKKRRKGYRVKNGHRQYLTKLEILNIDMKKGSSSDSGTKTSLKSTANKSTVTKKSAAKKSTVTKNSTAARKSTVTKNSTAAKKSTVKKKSTAAKKSTVKKKSTTTKK